MGIFSPISQPFAPRNFRPAGPLEHKLPISCDFLQYRRYHRVCWTSAIIGQIPRLSMVRQQDVIPILSDQKVMVVRLVQPDRRHPINFLKISIQHHDFVIFHTEIAVITGSNCV